MLSDTPQITTTHFNTYEEREEAFRKSVFSLIPRRYLGPGFFWRDFSRISFEESHLPGSNPIAYITSNPRDGLVYGSPWQVLTAAQLCAGSDASSKPQTIKHLAEAFGIAETLYQPIRTLSGGETVKLALAKSFICADFCSRLTIASPFSWLSRSNTILYENLCRHYAERQIPVSLFALKGENSNDPIGIGDTFFDRTDTPLEFKMTLRELKIMLSTSLNPIYSQETYAGIADIDADLVSPCLITGGNGQGKSLVAKALAGAVSTQGSTEIVCNGKTGPVRLLFQDVINQTLLRSFDRLAASSFPDGSAESYKLFTKIVEKFHVFSNRDYLVSSEPGLPGNRKFRTLMEVKSMLVAVRLCGQPRAIILDEPDWGLSRAASIAFVSAVIHIAHERGTPVFLISHKPWWTTIARSTVAVERTARFTETDRSSSFNITLRCYNELES